MDAEGNKHHPQSGLDYLRELLKDWHGSAMADTMNMRLIAVDDGGGGHQGIAFAQETTQTGIEKGGLCLRGTVPPGGLDGLVHERVRCIRRKVFTPGQCQRRA